MNKQILPLFLFAVLVVGAAIALLVDRDVEQTSSKPLFEELRAQATNVNKIVLTNNQGTLLDAQQQQGQWFVMSDVSKRYPADQQRLSDLLRALAEAVLVEAKTAKAENYARLGLDSINTPDSQSTLVEVYAGNQKWQVLIGNLPSSGVGHYIRKPSDVQSWLIDTTIDIAEEHADWLQQPILDISVAEVSSVSRMGEKGWQISRSVGETDSLVLDNLPEDRALRYEGILQSAVESLLSVRFDALAATDPSRWEDQGAVVSQLILTMSDGSAITAFVAQVNDEHFVRFEDNGDGNKPYWHQLDYKISSFSATQLSKSLEDLLEPLPTETGPSLSNIDEGEAPQE